MRKICDEAIEVTAKLAITHTEEHDRKRFWELYWGPMNLIEIREKTQNYTGDSDTIGASPIETAMVLFGNGLNLPDKLPGLARNVKEKCDRFLK